MQSNLISTHTTISCNFTSHFKYSWEQSEKKTAKHHEKLMRWKINSSRADLVENSVAKKKYRAQKTSRAENDDHKSYHANEGTSISVCIYCEWDGERGIEKNKQIRVFLSY